MRTGLAVMAFGTAFGFVLAWGRIADPDVIYAMLRWWEPDLYLVMGSAIAVGFVGTRWLRVRHARTLMDGQPVTWRTLAPSRNHVVGSMFFGLGWSVTCACPGPIAVLIGRGEVTALFTATGFLAGIALRDFVRDRRQPNVAPLVKRTDEAIAPGL